MKTGSILEVHGDLVPELFRDDAGSLEAFNTLSEEERRSKRGIIAMIERYNELHPLRLPK